MQLNPFLFSTTSGWHYYLGTFVGTIVKLYKDGVVLVTNGTKNSQVVGIYVPNVTSDGIKVGRNSEVAT